MAASELSTTPLFTDPTLIAYYKAENVNDSKASFNLTNHNTVGFNAAKFNNGFDFGSSNTTKYVDIADNLGLDTYQAGVWTWVGWVNVTTAPSSTESFIFGIEHNTKGQIAFEYKDVTGTKTLRFQTYNGTDAQVIDWSVTLTTGTWYHLALVKNGTSVTLYINGASQGSNTITLADNSPGRPNQVCFGTTPFDSQLFFSGLIDDTAFFSKALSSVEILSLANGFSSGGILNFFAS